MNLIQNIRNQIQADELRFEAQDKDQLKRKVLKIKNAIQHFRTKKDFDKNFKKLDDVFSAVIRRTLERNFESDEF